MFTLVVAVLGKVGDKFVVCNAACLWEAVHALVDFNVDVAIVDKGGKVVLFEDGRRDEGNRDHHVLCPSQVGIQVKVLDIHCHEEGIWGGDHTVENEFGRSETGCLGANITGVVDQVATYGPSDSAGLGFLGTVGDDVSKIGCFASFGDLIKSDEFDCVGASGLFVTVGKAAGFLSTGFFPEVALRTAQEFGVFNIFAGVWVDSFVCMTGGWMDDFDVLGIKAQDFGNGQVGRSKAGDVDVDGSAGGGGLGCQGRGKRVGDFGQQQNWQGRSLRSGLE